MATEKTRYAIVNSNGWTENVDTDDYFSLLSRIGRDTHNRWTLLLRNGVVVETDLSGRAWSYVKTMDDGFAEVRARVHREHHPDWLPKEGSVSDE